MLEAENSILLAFKPRQVLLAEQKKQQKSKRMVKKQEQQPNHKAALIHSILNYLQKNGFSKTFKRFLKEAQIKEDNWKDSLDLEDVYLKYLESSRGVDKNSEAHKEQDVTLEKGSSDLSEETINKKKKKKEDKKGLENDEGEGKGGPEETAKSKDKKEKHKLRTVSVVEDSQKTKKDGDAIVTPTEDCKIESNKRKKKKEVVVSEKSFHNGQETVDQGKSLEEEAISKKKKKDKKGLENDEGEGKGGPEQTAKSKDKKKKHKLRTVSVVEDGQKTKKNGDAIDTPAEDCKTESNKRKNKKGGVVSEKSFDGQEMVDQGKSLEVSENGTKKGSKKRKLSASDETENKTMEKSETGEPKRRKTEDLEEAKVGVQQGKLNAQENGQVDVKELENLSSKKVDGSTKGDFIQSGIQKSAGQKSERKQQNGSAQPKTAANTFQRVKVDEVKFVDERLQDNSYWAKDGAEFGYGAKAQEILGQVKGRGFRHEKTKKKRGSYRGGQIDFHSHSIKFNYDDDE